MSRILVIEDEPVIRAALRRLLERHDYQVEEARSVEDARKGLPVCEFDLVIADLRLPGAPGTDIIALAADCPVLIMTSYASVRSAVESMKLGAIDYIAKPFDHDEMLITVDRILGQNRLKRQNAALKSDVAREYPVRGMVGSCAAMREVRARIEKVAPTDTTVLVIGASGTGKELVARALHEGSRRNAAPMITLNCAAIPESLIENELFGHERGSYTGAEQTRQGVIEAADGGTLFLDEIGELPLEAQARLLRVLQEGEIRRVGATRTRRVDVRLVAATHRDLPALVREGRFREDLYFRLRVMEIRLPSLRERDDDVYALADMLLVRHCQRLHRARMQFSAAARRALGEYTWPGNVRELENAIERAVILADSDQITPELLALHPGGSGDPHTVSGDSADTAVPQLSLEEYFKAFVQAHQGRMSETQIAERLGISRKALWERRQRLEIPRPKH
jgi:DNA-binding NtrC family response regulator